MKYLYQVFLSGLFLTIFLLPVDAQRLRRADKALVAQLSLHEKHLFQNGSNDKESRVMKYICREFEKNGIEPKGDTGSYVHYFKIPDGVERAPNSFLFINNEKISSENYMPLLMSPAISLKSSPSLALLEAGQPWFLNFTEYYDNFPGHSAKGLQTYILTKANGAKKKGATVLFLYNTSTHNDSLTYDAFATRDSLPLPIVYVQQSVAQKYFSDETAMLDIKLNVKFVKKYRKGQYIAGFVDNGAESTVIIGSNENSNNAAALIETGKLLKKDKRKNNNYLLVAFYTKDSCVAEKASAMPNTQLVADYLLNTVEMASNDKPGYIRSIVEKAN